MAKKTTRTTSKRASKKPATRQKGKSASVSRKGKVVAAVGTAAQTKPGASSSVVEDAMSQAIREAMEQGIPLTNGKEVKRLMMEARAKAVGKN
jgi:hypothetical protein